MQFLIIHGSFGSADGNWFPELKEKLENLDQKVILPQFPVDNWDDIVKQGKEKAIARHQTLNNWLETFKKVLDQEIRSDDDLCIVAHSLGPLFTLHSVLKYGLKLDSAIFVSPFLNIPKLKNPADWPIQVTNRSFYKTDFDFSKLHRLIPVSYVLRSENDPYVPQSASTEFTQKLNSSVINVKGGGHLNAEVNLNEFPLVLELCKSRFDLTLYQKYKAHRSELFDIDYIRKGPEEVIYLNAKEVRDEGLFHFRNLRKGGFCTLYTGIADFWKTESVYMQEARRAAQRTNNVTRVFVVSRLTDLDKPSLLEQISLDIKGGVKVYCVMLDDIKDQVQDVDFGIWDDEYRCIVRVNPNDKVDDVILSSRQKDIGEAQKWRDYILSKATPIKKVPDDINQFKKQVRSN